MKGYVYEEKKSMFSMLTIHEWLVISGLFSCFLLLARMLVTGTLLFAFLPWNLFLAFIPYWITGMIKNRISILENKWKLVACLLACLVFIPNSFYIITDLFHLNFITNAPKWFDLLMIFSFAWNGILFGIISVRRIEWIVTLQTRKIGGEMIVFAVMFLSGWGIYIGRFLRFNSWDIITNPFSLFGEILNMIIHPFQNGYAWGMTLCYSVFMTVFYFTIRKLGENLR
jgi:uncharacterized membrane protein